MRKIRTLRIVPVSLVILALLLAGCTGGQSKPQSQPAPSVPQAPPPEKKPLRPFTIGVPVSPPSMVHLAPYIAMEKGFFEAQGLKVTKDDLKEFEGGLQALRGSAAGGLDVAGTSSDPLIIAASQGGGVKAIGTYAPKLSVVAVVQPGINKVEDLRGKRIGIQEVGGFNEVMARAVLATKGMKAEDVQYVTVATSGRVPGLVANKIDLAILHIDQYYAAMAKKPDLRVLANLWDVVPKWWYSAYMVREEQLKDPEERQALVGFITAIIKAQRFMYSNRDETIAIGVKYTGQDKDVVTKAYDDLAKGGIWAVNDGMPRDMIEYTISKQVEIGSIPADKKPTYEQVVDPSLAEEALKRLGGRLTGDPRWY